MRALLCPASLKGVLTARAAASALGRGVREGGAEAVELPVADGGEGTAEALESALGGEWREARVSDPLGRPVAARWLLLHDGRAVVEAAAAIGLPLLSPAERDPRRASSRGLGELLAAALETSPAALVVALGGTATVDGGEGLREVVSELRVPTVVLCDVRTRLADAARLFGPQKGASPGDVAFLERRLEAMDELAPFAELPGSGAAGGLGAALAAFGGELVPGAPAVLDLLGFDERLAESDLVVTGEGRVDRTTAEGKAPGEVARRALEAGVRCVVFGGRVDVELDGVENVALSGDPARAEIDLCRAWTSPRSRGGSGFSLTWVSGSQPNDGVRLKPDPRLRPVFGRGEPVGHRLEQLPRDLRAGLDVGPEDEDREAERPQLGFRRHRRGARAPVDQRDLAERVPGPEPADLVAVDLHGRLSALHHEEHEPALALEGDRVALREAPLVELLGQALELALVERREELDVPEELGGRLGHRSARFIHDGCRRCHAFGGVARGQLLDPDRRRLEALHARAVQLLAPPEERDRVVDGHISPLEAGHDVVELALELLERPLLAHGTTSSTRAPSRPDASSMSSSAPRVTAPAARSAVPSARTIA